MKDKENGNAAVYLFIILAIVIVVAVIICFGIGIGKRMGRVEISSGQFVGELIEKPDGTTKWVFKKNESKQPDVTNKIEYEIKEKDDKD